MRGRKNGYTYNTKKTACAYIIAYFPISKTSPHSYSYSYPYIRCGALRPTAYFMPPRIKLAVLLIV